MIKTSVCNPTFKKAIIHKANYNIDAIKSMKNFLKFSLHFCLIFFDITMILKTIFLSKQLILRNSLLQLMLTIKIILLPNSGTMLMRILDFT